MKIATEQLIQEMIQITESDIITLTEMKSLPLEKLNQKPSEKSWSALECFAHLNWYSNFYLPEISKRIKASKHGAVDTYKSGWLGEYFAKTMKPTDKMKTMKTFKECDFCGSDLSMKELDQLLSNLKQWVELLNQAKSVHLMKTKTSISISNFIKLRLGDTFRVNVYHNQRHILQAGRVIKS